MYFKYSEPKLQSLISLTDNVGLISDDLSIKKGLIHIIWNISEEPVTFYIDNVPLTLNAHQITTSTYLQLVRFKEPQPELTVFSFNREFYCIQDHDYEVSCNGIIFFGTQETPIIRLLQMLNFMKTNLNPNRNQNPKLNPNQHKITQLLMMIFLLR